jgi:hypothetical protein
MFMWRFAATPRPEWSVTRPLWTPALPRLRLSYPFTPSLTSMALCATIVRGRLSWCGCEQPQYLIFSCGSKATPNKRNRAAGVRKHGRLASLSRKAGVGRQPYNEGVKRDVVSHPACRGVVGDPPRNIIQKK